MSYVIESEYTAGIPVVLNGGTCVRKNLGSRDKESVYSEIRTWIVSGKLAPGSPISERELADLFGLSRTPIREVLHRLHLNGLIQIYPHRGAFVTHPDPHVLAEIFEAREVIEPAAAGLAALRYDPGELTALRAQFEGLQISDDPASIEAGIQLGSQLHESIIGWSRNSLLSAFYGQLRDRASLVRGLTRGRRDIEEASRQAHLFICQALLSRDPSLAEAAMRTHLRETRDKLLSQSRLG